MRAPSPDIAALVAGLRRRDRASLGRAITLIESRRPADRERAARLLQAALPHAGGAHRIGITGVPGVGKSTLIDQLGIDLIARGHRVAVLAVDPTSTRSGGSVLGDKTRMGRLAQAADAFIRPSPTGGTLGGVARRTRETIALLEAAGFTIVIVETVGVGQSEVTVAGMVDVFLVLLLAGGGDDLQGIKKGVIEIADVIAINKADGDNVERAGRAAAEYMGALNILTPASARWRPPVLTVSGQANIGLDRLWSGIEEHRAIMEAAGERLARRREQAVQWMHEMLADSLMEMLLTSPGVESRLPALEAEVRTGRLAPSLAVAELVAAARSGGCAGGGREGG